MLLNIFDIRLINLNEVRIITKRFDNAAEKQYGLDFEWKNGQVLILMIGTEEERNNIFDCAFSLMRDSNG